MVATLKISQVNISGGTQPRARIDLDLVAEYADRILAGDAFPPVEVVFDGKDYWLWDGFHRYHGHVKAGKKEIAVNIREGTARDAVLLSCGANGHHGLRRTPEDKRNAVLRLLEDAEWASRSNRWISEQCNVSEHFVAKTRPAETTCAPRAPEPADGEPRHYDDSESQEEPERQPPKRTGRDGKKYPAKSKPRTVKPPTTAAAVANGKAPKTKPFDESAGTEHLKRLRWWIDERGGKFGKGAEHKKAIAEFNALAETIEAWQAKTGGKVERIRK